ncbi:GNAT family N-acetyltransferase [Shewanella psychrotolerans]|uniref:GNAT family N-acetyltransferase n=1 Tax=Shewanella psychrotolerans TaxID=2864206 RepID=UPI001C65E7C8|nr:GNAT family N-acetyltransferase [Shewanella psychrotolerans]QYK00187.1 GNAT family N-acetyltransferase [Shewanella psychrotolerans]
MLIRIAIEDDLSALAILFDKYRQNLGQAASIEDSHEFMRSRLSENDSVIFVAIVDEQVIGFIQLYPSFSSRFLKPLWYFDDLYVAEPYRHNGIGRCLVDKAKELADETNALAVRREHFEQDGWLLMESIGTQLTEFSGKKVVNS